MAVQPPHGAAGSLLAPADELHIPVFVRRSSPLQPQRRPMPQRVNAAAAPWPATGQPRPGIYLARTTWRDIIDAAATVGRDPTGWLAAVPALAWAELIARRAPLLAYLGRTQHSGPDGDTFHLEPNVVYHHGTETSAQAGFGYRMGMTMAEWACRGLLRLGPTDHAESILPPPTSGPGWSAAHGLPDLVAHMAGAPWPWLIEAKGGRRTGLTVLREGAGQLTRDGLMDGPHVRVLCGTSLEDRVFVTLDLESVDGGASPAAVDGPPTPTSPDSILDLARSRMLFYLALRALPPDRLRIIPVGQQVATFRTSRTAALTMLLEYDPSTRDARDRARRPDEYRRQPRQHRYDMITGRVPGTDLIVGLSRRLYAACERLADPEAGIAASVDEDIPVRPPTSTEPSMQELDERRLNRETLFRARERQERPRLAEEARAGFEYGADAEWPDLIAADPPLLTDTPDGFLEAATADSYLAVTADTATQRHSNSERVATAAAPTAAP